ncbi:MAG: glycosyltransferase family 1 protein [Candidatus Auribacterota bacterium]|jgi:glycosyltransferase involved in cell wall biosynthesis|nr:glycosyltransferase family 1 protein [Candidatus Auribacterota bacterium]
MTKHIIIDARVCDGHIHGISRVSEQFIYNILDLDSSNRYTVLCPNDYPREKFPKKESITYLDAPIPLYSIKEQWAVWRLARSLNPDLFHCPTFTAPLFAGFPVAVNIHDLIPVVYPELFPFKYKVYYNTFVPRICRKAVRIFTSSNGSKQDIMRFYGITEDKITVVYNSAYSPNDTIEPYVAESVYPDYVIFVGNQMPHKNFIRAAQAFDIARKRLGNKNITMVTVGISEDFFRQSQVGGLENIVCLPYLSPGKLQSVYKGAGVMLFPSLYEGFGIPPLEAMSFEVPVISSNCSCMPEVLGDAYLSVDPLDVEQMAHALHSLYTDEKLRASLIAKGIKQVAKYSWRESARKILGVYGEILS